MSDTILFGAPPSLRMGRLKKNKNKEETKMAEARTVQELMGAPGSPYTRKMLGVMRFRNIPYRLERARLRLHDRHHPHHGGVQ